MTEEEKYIKAVLKAARAYARSIETAKEQNKASVNLPEYLSWHDLIMCMSPLFIIDLCEAWRELQLIKQSDQRKTHHD